MAKAPSRYAYLYVIGPAKAAQPVKVGRSNKPGRRVSELQVGNADKLVIHGQFRVLAADACRLETAAKRALFPLRIKGEVFDATHWLACAVVKWIAAGNPEDEFIRLAVAHEVACRQWEILDKRPSSRGRWATEEAKEAVAAAWAEFCRLGDEMGALDPTRADEADPMRVDLRKLEAG